LAEVLGPDMKAEDRADLWVIQDSFFYHKRRAALLARVGAFGGGLEDELDVALEAVLERVEDVGRPEDDGGVHVVTAGVHNSRRERLEGNVGHLLDRQGVELGPDGERRARLGSAEKGDDPRLGDAGLIVYANLIQHIGDTLGRANFLEGKLRVHMQVTADGDESIAKRLRASEIRGE
jgi:hypothetical protein